MEGVGAHEAEAAAPGLQLQQPPPPLAAVGPHQHAEVAEVAARLGHGEGGLASLRVSPITSRQTETRGSHLHIPCKSASCMFRNQCCVLLALLIKLSTFIEYN